MRMYEKYKNKLKCNENEMNEYCIISRATMHDTGLLCECMCVCPEEMLYFSWQIKRKNCRAIESGRDGGRETKHQNVNTNFASVSVCVDGCTPNGVWKRNAFCMR